jgi:hypothetical protein
LEDEIILITFRSTAAYIENLKGSNHDETKNIRQFSGNYDIII